MTVFEHFKNKSIDELVDWLDKYGTFDNSPWAMLFDKNYCRKCETELVYVPEFGDECDCSWCELNNKCKFFKELNDTPDNKQMIKMWLESEATE